MKRLKFEHFVNSVPRNYFCFTHYYSKEYSYYDWIVPSASAPSGTYDVVLSGFSVVANGTYSLADTGEVYFFISAQGISSTVGQTVTDSGTVAIRKDSVTVSSGTITLYARSQGVIV